MNVQIPRTWADATGESHFDTVEYEMTSTPFVPSNPPLELTAPQAATAAVFCDLEPGWDGSWHPTPRRQYAVTLSGTWEITVTGGERRSFGPGDVVLLDDRSGRGHSTVVTGTDKVRVLLIWLGQESEAAESADTVSS